VNYGKFSASNHLTVDLKGETDMPILRLSNTIAICLTATVIAMFITSCDSRPSTTVDNQQQKNESSPSVAKKPTAKTPSESKPASSPPLADKTKIVEVAQETYIEGYPLLESARVIQAVATAAPAGFLHLKRNSSSTGQLLATPDLDAPMSLAAVPLGNQPVLVSLPTPSSAFRYLVQVADLEGRTIFNAAHSTLTNDTCRLAIIGPDADPTADVPADVQAIRIASRWALIRLRWITGASDEAPAFVDVRNRCVITQADYQAAKFTEPAIGAETFTTLKALPSLAKLVQAHAPSDDHPLRKNLARLGLMSERPTWDSATKNEDVFSAINSGVSSNYQGIMRQSLFAPTSDPAANGWSVFSEPSEDNKLGRCSALAHGFYWSTSHTAILFASVDRYGQTLNGRQRYVLRFPANKMPNAEGGWSLAAYDIDTGKLLAPRLDIAEHLRERIGISNRTMGLTYVEDGSLTLYVQRDPPGDQRDTNWLPCPPGNFYLCLYTVLPDADLRDGRYYPPGLQPLMEPPSP
jgi:hypothetical protein